MTEVNRTEETPSGPEGGTTPPPEGGSGEGMPPEGPGAPE